MQLRVLCVDAVFLVPSALPRLCGSSPPPPPTSHCPPPQFWDIVGGTAGPWHDHIAQFPTLRDVQTYHATVRAAKAS
jgi:hypothetical protein